MMESERKSTTIIGVMGGNSKRNVTLQYEGEDAMGQVHDIVGSLLAIPGMSYVVTSVKDYHYLEDRVPAFLKEEDD